MDTGVYNMAKVILYPGESIESALYRFGRACSRDGIFKIMRDGQSYKKPSTIRRDREFVTNCNIRKKKLRKAEKENKSRKF